MSPIESMLLNALRECIPGEFKVVDFTGLSSAFIDPEGEIAGFSEGASGGFGEELGTGDAELHLWRQVQLLTYKADIVIEIGKELLSIECDGHDFHDRTKQQAAYDRARDRELLAAGILTARFTGSEIVHSAERCARDVYAIAKTINDRQWAKVAEWQAGYSAGAKSVTRARVDLSELRL